ncbi:MAG: homocysteine S-methyltransferase family protein [Clostridium sp.]|nr:homocysteine S-methyltransferase family protein [Clostridium sp.]
MNRKEWNAYCQGRYVILDGATGSNLMRAGMPAGVCPEQWIVEHRDVMLSLQKEYVAAGSDILYAPTFTANRLKLREYGLEEKQRELIQELVGISKEAAAGRALIAGDLTMTGVQLAPIGTLDFEELVDIYKEQIRNLCEAGVDLLVVETMMSLQETRAALIAAKEVCDLPVLASLTFEKDGRTLYGTDAVTAVITLQSLGAAAVGANCSTGPEQMVQLIGDMAKVANVPVIAKPNAGMPVLMPDGTTGYSMTAETFAEEMMRLTGAGAAVVGGCCGTTPKHIGQLARSLAGKTPPDRKRTGADESGVYYLTSERKTVSFGLNSPFLVIGERINPTGKKKLQAELKEGSLSMVSEFAESQEKMGAAILDVNMGMPGINEKEMMLKALDEVGMASNLPLSIDSSHVDVIEAALRRYPGRALINSISMEEAKCEPLLQLAAKYGAMFILLPLSDEGLPKSLEEKFEIIEKVTNRAAAHGLTRQDIVVDGLVMTVGADQEAALLTLQTFAKCHELGYATTCGLSNISFGLPERSYVNASFLTMAVQNGLTMAIANPSQQLLMSTAYAADLLLHKEGADIRYIEYAAYVKEQAEQEEQQKLQKLTESVGKAMPQSAAGQDNAPDSAVPDMLRPVYDAVLKGMRSRIAELTESLLRDGQSAQDILNLALMPAIDEVGILFDKGKYFLPQLINSAEAMKLSIAVLEPHLMGEGGEKEQACVVIATVKGDIHDIGKNLVALMLKNHGFRVIDLGKDVESGQIIETAKKEHADVIALSALMTTTMMQMKEVVRMAHEQKLTAKIIIGGAVITQDFADEIGADGYSRDAAEAVVVVKKLLEERCR